MDGALQLASEVREIPFRDPFRIARDPNDAVATTVLVELHDPESGLVGLGEGFPDGYYGETPATMLAVFPLLLAAVGSPDWTEAGLAEAALRMDAALGHNGAAKCAIDIALHDVAAKRAGLPLHAFLGLPAEIPPTDFSIGIDEPAVVAERARRAARFPALKIKVGGSADLATLEAVRAVYGGRIRVDANTAWTFEDALAILPALERLGVELIEQPFAARRHDLLRAFQERSALPVVADESAVTIDDLDALVGVTAGVNVKLAKCGGVGPAKRMLERASELGLRTFIGCMEETSVGVAASAAVASLAEWLDLDGCLLLADDPFEGLELDEGSRWRLGRAPGLGVVRRSADRAG
ncbi:MAG: dipeptide epimerase [Chloroflexi bacterium]|nr:dipeptide epimerase [Chloroflexota bacterium]